MASNLLTRPIPPTDQLREQIAVRRSERQRRFHYGSEPVPAEPAKYPVYMSFQEVIGWIACSRITALEGLTACESAFFSRWGFLGWGGGKYERQVREVHQLRYVIARVRLWQRAKRQMRPSQRRPLRPLSSHERRTVRLILRKHGGPARAVLKQLRADARNLLADRTSRGDAIEHARQQCCAEIAAEHLVAWGIPGISRERRFTKTMHEAIPAVFFANEQNTICLDGWATCAPAVSPSDWANWRGLEWGDVKFKREDVFHIWPKNPPPGNTDPEETIAHLRPTARGEGIVTPKAFDQTKAKALLAAKKASKEWSERPKEGDAIDFLKLNFTKVPRDPVRKLLNELWGPGKRGPR